MSFASMHNDYLDPDKHLWPDDPPCETCKHDVNGQCKLIECDYSQKVDAAQVGGDHYVKLRIQPWDVMQAWFPQDHFKSYLLMNAIKYLARDKTDKRQDVEKAKHYLEKWLEITNA